MKTQHNCQNNRVLPNVHTSSAQRSVPLPPLRESVSERSNRLSIILVSVIPFSGGNLVAVRLSLPKVNRPHIFSTHISSSAPVYKCLVSYVSSSLPCPHLSPSRPQQVMARQQNPRVTGRLGPSKKEWVCATLVSTPTRPYRGRCTYAPEVPPRLARPSKVGNPGPGIE